MPRNGSGVYTLPAGNPVVTGTTISSTVQNNTTSDIATALTQSIAVDGQSSITANIPLGGNKITGLGAGTLATDAAQLQQVQGAAQQYATESGTNTILLTVSPTPSAYAAGQVFRFIAAAANTSAVTINVNSLGAKALTKGGTVALVGGEIAINSLVTVAYDGTQFQLQNIVMQATNTILGRATAATGPVEQITMGAGVSFASGALVASLRSYLTGCTMSTAGSSATMSIAAGQATDSTNVSLMNLAAIAKTTSGWALGTGVGGLDTGSIANATWYHFYVIQRPDTGVVDLVFSTSASAPTLPTNYTLYRRIGSGLTNGSAQWVAFSQLGDEFLWLVNASDVSNNTQGTTAVLYPLSTPLGVKTIALIEAHHNSSSTGANLWISSPDQTDTAVNNATNFNAGGTVTGATLVNLQAGIMQIRTDTSSQIRVRSGSASTNISIATRGWIDRRGKDN